MNISRLNDMEASSLEIPFSVEEVSSALSDLNGDKAPGSDGLTVAFWQLCWDIVRDDVMRMFRDFHEARKFVRSLNSMFIVMIPKKGGAEDLKDFCSISSNIRNFSPFWMCGANSLANLPSQCLTKVAYRTLSFYRKQIPTCIATKLSSALALLNIQEFIITEIRHTLQPPSKLETSSFYRLWCLFPTGANSLLEFEFKSASLFQNLALSLNSGSNLEFEI